MKEIIAENYLTQSAEVSIEERILVKKVMTPDTTLWREATEQEIVQVQEYQQSLNDGEVDG